MPKKDDSRTPKSKMTFIMFQLDGGDETLQQSFRTIGQALGNAFQQVKQLPNRPLPLANPSPDQEADAEILEESELEAANNSHNDPPNRHRTRSAPKSPIVLDLKLDEGNPPLKEFLAGKNVGDEDTKRYLAIAYWLKHNLGLAEVTPDHIHTGYRHMGWHTPKDAGLPLRAMKSKQQWFKRGTAAGAYAINHIGENKVNAMGGAS